MDLIGKTNQNAPDPQPIPLGDIAPDLEQTPLADEEVSVRPPSIANFLEHRTQGEPEYSELASDRITESVDPENLLKAQFGSLKDKAPHERANIGGKFGAKIGATQNGLPGAVLGAGLGAVIARGMGLSQTGELEDSKRREQLFDTFKTLGLANDKGEIGFEDGASMLLTNDPGFKLKNIDASVIGKADRSIMEIDSSNPFTKRTEAVAKPLAYYISNGLMQWGDMKNVRDKTALATTTNVLVNALQNGATNINQIYNRARKMAEKAGLSEDAFRTYFNNIKNNVDDNDAALIRQGLDTIYAP